MTYNKTENVMAKVSPSVGMGSRGYDGWFLVDLFVGSGVFHYKICSLLWVGLNFALVKDVLFILVTNLNT
jgi:hypothetical protein